MTSEYISRLSSVQISKSGINFFINLYKYLSVQLRMRADFHEYNGVFFFNFKKRAVISRDIDASTIRVSRFD